jgi:hypothetical protein
MNKEVVVYQRGEMGFECVRYIGDDGEIPLPCLKVDLPMAEIYEGVQLPALEVVEEEG